MFKLGLILTCIALGCFVQEANSAYLSVDSFFNTSGNLAVITWAQGINSIATLSQALNGPAMMLEGDVIWGELLNTPIINNTALIMSANVSSDLSLFHFLSLVQNHNAVGNQTRKGVQLNFWDISVLETALIPLLTTIPRLDYPVWLHTEVIAGADGLIPRIGAVDFLDRVIGFRNSTISLSWTTISPTALGNVHIDNMVHALESNGVDQVLTFPVRADIAALSVLQLQDLARRVPQSSLTIWGDASLFNQVAVNNIRTIIINVGINRTILVVPDNIRVTLTSNLPNSVGITSLSATCFLLALIANLT